MVALNYKLDIAKVVDFHNVDQIQEGVYLWVLHADKIPPHIGVSIDGRYFSLKSNGKDEDVAASSVLSIVARKNIRSLLFEVESSVTKTFVQQVFDQFDKTITGEVTCLNPLKEVFGYAEPRQLQDLLTELDKDNRINEVIGLNLSADFTGISTYELEDIHERLRKLDYEN
jgi:hypothetical protein